MQPIHKKNEEEIEKKLEQTLIVRGEVPVDDLNFLEESGIYWIGATQPANSCKECDWSKLIVINSGNLIHQIILRPGKGFIGMRQKAGSPSVWSNWYKITGQVEL